MEARTSYFQIYTGLWYNQI